MKQIEIVWVPVDASLIPALVSNDSNIFNWNNENNIIIIRKYRSIGVSVRVLANGPGEQGSFPGWVIPKTPKNA